MPNVPFKLKDFGLDPTTPRRANVIFTPSVPAAIGVDGILIGRRVVKWSDIHPITGAGVAVVAQTTTLRPECHLIVSIEWIDDAPSGWGELAWPLRVPAEGGNLVDLLDMPGPGNAVAVRPSSPGTAVGIGGTWIDNSVSPPRLKTRSS
ncbi:hypothetical protein C5E10_17995 [Pseudoclavibacter sp. RFBG4]|uniref:hypothetical protein n=1 Tax=Pseudoclavibacter sp. RFBG4 TaxID=2080575 RepID=UPI000CE7ECFF|nr:hypothetical protein [Pseudoclavibacter sp. RFBG4]PPG25962.1 hypothetical protein C5E10_17995 [Pseudoclavibacter sp. RFBG4]